MVRIQPVQAAAADTAHLRFGRRWLICEIAAVLLAGGYIGLVLSPVNRLFMYFGWRDTMALIVLLLVAGSSAAAVLHALAHATRGRSDRWLAPWFYFLLVMVIFNLFPNLRQTLVKKWPDLSGTLYYLSIWGSGTALTIGGYIWGRMRRMASAGWRGVFLLWPLLLLLSFNLLTARKWEPGAQNPIAMGRHAGGQQAPVIIIILDMIGYGNLFSDNGQIPTNFPCLAEFSRSAMVFHRARSCGNATVPSLPGLILQKEVDGPVLKRDAACWKIQADPAAPACRAEDFSGALPRRFRAVGGRAVYIGYYLPYQELMPGMWDGVYSPCFYGVAWEGGGDGWAATLTHHIVQYLIASKDPVAGLAKQFGLYLPLLNCYHREITRNVIETGRRYIEQCLSPGDLVFIHVPAPHPPIVFDANGGPSRYGREDPAGYPDQLRYADRLFGELVATIKQAGQWDRSWVIMMSDHGSHFQDFSADPMEKRHVPFMVKAPGQAQRQDLDVPIRLADFEQIPGFPAAVVR